MAIEMITAMLAKKGLSLLASAVDGAGDKAVSWIEEKTGIKLSGDDGPAEFTNEQLMALRQLESDERVELERLALEKFKEGNRHAEATFALEVNDRDSAREMYTKGGKEMQDRLIDWVFKFTSFIIPALLLADVLLVVFAKKYGIDPTICTAIGTLIGICLGRFGDERKTILEYAFGGSAGNDRLHDDEAKI